MGIRLLYFSNQTAGEAGEETFWHSFQVNRRTVACQNNALAITEKMVEDVEEGLLSLGSSHPFLDIIHNQHIYRLIESDKVVLAVLQYSVSILHLEKTSTYIKHTLLGIELLGTHTNGINQMRFSAT